MGTKRIIAYLLFAIAGIFVVTILAASFHYGDVKSFGATFFAAFFLSMAGWIIGDF